MNEVANNSDVVNHRSATQSLRCCSRKRAVHFLVRGLVGGTAIVVVASFVFDDWAYLGRCLSGLAAVVIVSVYILGKKWLVGQAINLTQRNVEPTSRT